MDEGNLPELKRLTNFFHRLLRAESDSDAGASLHSVEHHDKNCKLLKQVAGWNDLLSLGALGRLWRRRDVLSREERPELEDDEHDGDRDRDLDRGMKNGNDERTTLRLSLKWLPTACSH
jgi:hypothetical protein